MKKRKQDSIYARAVRLVEGGVVEVDGHAVRAVKAPVREITCEVCEMDSICRKDDVSDMPWVCKECEEITGDGYYLKLVQATARKP